MFREDVSGQEDTRRRDGGKPQQRDGARVLQSVPSLRLSVAELAVFRRRQDRAHPLHGEVGRAVAAHHDLDAQHHPYRRAGACRAGHAVHRRGAAAAFLRLRHRGVDPEEEMGADHLRRSGKGRRQDRPAARRGDRQYRLAQAIRGQRGLFLPLAGLRVVGRRVVRREEGQGGRPRHPGQRSSAGDRDRPAAQRPAASASRRGIQGMVRRPRLEGRFSGVGAGAPHPVQERHSRHRECRRRHRQGHRPALHLRVLPVELGPRRRLHHPPGRHRSIPKGKYRIEKGEKFE